jgi:hypothetical protein
MQTWRCEQDPDFLGEEPLKFFTQRRDAGLIKDAGIPAARILELIRGDDKGLIVDMLRKADEGKLVDVETVTWGLG